MSDRSGERAGIWTLTDKLGEGGMAEVWRGEAEDAAQVAIKVLPRASQGTFEHEAAALARLVHPHIIRILDFGRLNDADSTPFLALELARGPSLEAWMRATPLGWSDVLEIARRVLMALAHAHSRGLVHRDIKPANLLAMDRGGTDWRLTDFGIAFTEERDQEDEHNPSGTPRYMAPEQFIGKVHAQGPWTDLYSFGCVLHELVTGRPPFQGSGPMQLAFDHLKAPVPKLDLKLDVPDGAVELIRVLLRKDPLARFRSAADVLRALEKLPRPERSAPSVVLNPEAMGDATMVTPAYEATLILGDLDAFDWEASNEERPPNVEPAPPPIEPPATSPRHYFGTFHGDTGPGISGLRELPFVGRVEERHRIWSAFRKTVSERRPHIIAVQGEAGIGKSAVGTWLTRAVDEHGFGVAIHVDRPDDPATALLRAVRAAYRLDADDARRTRAHLELWSDADEWATSAVARALAGDDVGEQDTIAATLTVLWAQAHARPVVLFVDDVDRDARWTTLVERIGEEALEAPVFVVVATSRPLPTLRDHLHETVELGPFAAGECAELVTELVGLSVEHAYAIADAVDGHPHFAVEVVQSWIDQHLLVRSGGKWTLRGKQRPPLPDSVGAVRWQQFEAAVAERPFDRAALELLACFGTPCRPEHWREACAVCELRIDHEVENRAVRAGLIESRNGELQFADRVLRRRIVQATVERNTHRTYHQAIAAVVRHNPERWGPAALGTHLFEAGDYANSKRYLLRALRNERIDQVQLQELLSRYERAVEALQCEHTVDGGWVALMRAMLLSRQAKIPLALESLREVMRWSRENGWTELECDAIARWANLASPRAPSRADGELAVRGVQLADQLEDDGARVRARTAAGAMLGYLGDLNEALELYLEARTIAQQSQNLEGLGHADYGRGWVFFLQGRLQDSLEPLNEAREELREAGNLREAYSVLSFTGDVLRALGELEQAERAFTEAYQYLSRFQIMDPAVPANFALLEVARARYDDALRWARRAGELGRVRGRSPLLALAAGVELLHAAHCHDLERWDRAFAELESLERGDDASYDNAYVLDAATRVALGTLADARAEKIAQHAIRHWEALGRTSESDALRALIDQ